MTAPRFSEKFVAPWRASTTLTLPESTRGSAVIDPQTRQARSDFPEDVAYPKSFDFAGALAGVFGETLE